MKMDNARANDFDVETERTVNFSNNIVLKKCDTFEQLNTAGFQFWKWLEYTGNFKETQINDDDL